MDGITSRIAKITGDLLWRHEAVRVNLNEPFRLASGDLAPVYINCRRMISFPAARSLIISFAQFVASENGIICDCVAGGETAGIPYGAWLAERLNKPFVYIRKKPKEYGARERLEGVPEGRVLLVEDLITDGGSKLGFVEAVREAGATVTDCLTLVDREQGGRQALGTLGVSLHSIVGISTCLAVGCEKGLLSEEELKEVQDYLADPHLWNKNQAIGS